MAVELEFAEWAACKSGSERHQAIVDKFRNSVAKKNAERFTRACILCKREWKTLAIPPAGFVLIKAANFPEVPWNGCPICFVCEKLPDADKRVLKLLGASNYKEIVEHGQNETQSKS